VRLEIKHSSHSDAFLPHHGIKNTFLVRVYLHQIYQPHLLVVFVRVQDMTDSSCLELEHSAPDLTAFTGRAA
jgi:hypothetical protein